MATDTLVIVFTDLVDSTAQRVHVGDRVADSIRREHDALVRDACIPRGGTFVKSTGDGALLTFRSASAAIDAAAEMQRGLALRNVSAEHPFELRIGATIGEVSLEDGDVFGLPVNGAARLCDSADSRQILVSTEVQSLAGSRCAVALVHAGELLLKGFEHPVEVWAAQWSNEAPTSLKASAAAVGRTRGSVPMPATSFVGRERELAELDDALASARLLTMLGPGGIGKTRLAIELAQRRLGDHADGVWFIDLSAVTDDRAIATHILKTIGSGDSPHITAQEQLATYLADRDTLLVIDNCEHVVARVAEIVDDLLRRTSRAVIVATSRERLQVPGEVVWPVPTIGVADDHDDAVTLFAERAAAVGAELRDSDRDDVTSLCRLLDGLPLAIELAAARCRTVPPSKVLERLRARPGSALGANRTGPERQRTVDGLVAWSVDLLSSEERELFTRLAVFTGSFSLDTVEEVCGDPDDDADVLDLLEQLVDKSLVSPVARSSGPTRYRLLFTILTHAASLGSPEQTSRLMGHLIGHLRERFEHATARLQGPEQDVVFHELADDHELLRHALQPAADGHDPARRRLAAVAGHWWLFAGHLREANALLAGLLTGPDIEPEMAAMLHAWHAEVLHELSNDEAGFAAAADATRALDTAGEAAAAWTRWSVGFAQARRLPPHAAAALADTARSNGWDHAEVRALIRWFDAANLAGPTTPGREQMQARLLAAAERLGDRQQHVEALLRVRFNRAHLGDVPGAVHFASRGVATAAGSVLRSLEVNALLTRCDAHERVGDYEAAMRDSTDALLAVGSLDLPVLRARALYVRANVLAGMGQFEDAIVELERLLDDAALARAHRFREMTMNLLTVACSLARRASEAHGWFTKVRQLTGGRGDWAVWAAPYYASVIEEGADAVMLVAAQRTLFPFIGASDHERLDELISRTGSKLSAADRDRLIARGSTMTHEQVSALAIELLERRGD